jgi:two-component system, NtrC family, sensor kinase
VTDCLSFNDQAHESHQLMKITGFILILFSYSVSGLGQDHHQIDHLKSLLAHSEEDSSKGLTIREICRIYVYTNPDSCLFYANLGLELIKNRSIREKFEKSNNHFLNGFEWRMYLSIATALAQQRNDTLAVKMALKALDLGEKSGDKYDMLPIYYTLSEVYQFIGDPGVAIEYLRKEILLDTAEHSRTSCIVTLGACFFDKGEYDSALYYIKGIDPAFKIDGTNLWPYPHLYLGKTYAKKLEYTKALGYYRTAISYAILSNYSQDLCDAYLGIADVFRNLHSPDSAIFYAKRAFEVSKNFSFPDRTMEASSFLASAYDGSDKKDSAIRYLKMAVVLKDSLQNGEKIRQIQNFTFEEKFRQREIMEQEAAYRSRVRVYVLLGGIAALLLIAGILYRNNRHKQKMNAILQSQKDELQSTLSELNRTQSQLIQSEKMASLGEMATGIAHEIQNPLNFVNNFADLNEDLLNEMKDEISSGHYEEAGLIAGRVIENEQKIKHHGKRADGIVKGMLQHSRKSSGQKELTDVNALVDEYVRLAYHSLQTKDKDFTVTIKVDLNASVGKIQVIPSDIGRVILNLCNNAFYAVSEKKKQQSESYEPTISVGTHKTGNKVEIAVKDNGNGIPQKLRDKIFQPFFTTKPTGQGTGLGLSLCYDIIKAHGGEISVDSKEGEFTEFVVTIPIPLIP